MGPGEQRGTTKMAAREENNALPTTPERHDSYSPGLEDIYSSTRLLEYATSYLGSSREEVAELQHAVATGLNNDEDPADVLETALEIEAENSRRFDDPGEIREELEQLAGMNDENPGYTCPGCEEEIVGSDHETESTAISTFDDDHGATHAKMAMAVECPYTMNIEEFATTWTIMDDMAEKPRV